MDTAPFSASLGLTAQFVRGRSAGLLTQVFEFHFAADLDPGPAPEQIPAARSNTSNRRFVQLPGQPSRGKLREFVSSPKRSRTAFTIEQADDTFDFASFIGERPSSPLSCGIFNVPS